MRSKELTINYFKTFIKPQVVFENTLRGNEYFTDGFKFIIIPIVGYTLMYIFLTIGGGAPSVFTPWLNIPKVDYYYVNCFLLAPGMILAWLSASSVMHILSRFFKGNGTFEQTLALMSLSISVAMAAALIHDLPMSFLSAINIINAKQHELAMNSPTFWRTLLWIFYTIYFVLFVILFYKCVLVIQNFSRTLSFLIGFFSFLVFQGIFLIFNR